MQLVGPWLSTTGKKRGKKKWASAEAKQQAEQLEREWKDIQSRHLPAKSTSKATTVKKSYGMATNNYRGSDLPKIPSLDTGGAQCTKMPTKVYTGDKIIGIGTMHKSNMVPIFNSDQAKDISSMRR
jgi:hypothetical protein